MALIPLRIQRMVRLFVAALVLAFGVVVTAPADTAKESEATKEYKKLEKEFLEKIEEAESVDRPKVLKEYSAKFMTFAEKNPKEDVAFDSLVYVLRTTRPSTDKDNVNTKAFEAIKKDHLKNKRLVKWLPIFMNYGQNGVSVLKTISEQHPDRKVQAKAIKTSKQIYEMAQKTAARIKDNEELRKKVEAARGKEYVADLLASAEKADEEVKKLDKLLAKYDDIVVDLSVGKKVPEVVIKDLDDKEAKLSALKGKVVVIDIWATWCGPCVAMIPHTRELVKKMKDKPFVFVSVSADAKKETVTAFIKTKPMPWTHWWNGASGGIVEDWNVEYFPTIYIIDHKGIIRYKDLRGDKMDEAVEKLVKEAEDDKPAKKEDKEEKK